jgi:hypothetical protein
MKHLIAFSVSACLIAMGTALAPRLNADAWDQLTKVTFSAPVEIPGQVLPAGSYWFKLVNPQSGRNVVQITNEKQDKVIATLLALPDSNTKPSDKTVITFEERAKNAPEAVKAWFYPGDDYGERFVYPKTRAGQLAKRTNQPVPSMPDNMEAHTKTAAGTAASSASVTALKQTSVKVQHPSGQEAEIETVVAVPPKLSATK